MSKAGSPLEKLGEATYEDLFVTALRNHGMLSIGLYRSEYKEYFLFMRSLRYLDLSDEVDATIARYVITNPPNDFKMHPTDKVTISDHRRSS